MNNLSNTLEKAMASLLTKGIRKEREGIADCWGWDYQAPRPSQSKISENDK